MRTAAHILFLLWGCLADALVVLNKTASSPSSAPSASSSDTQPATRGCVVEIPVIHEYTWQPHYIATTIDPKDVATNAAGTQITSIPITTGAYRENGLWTALTSLSTITFPTRYIDIGNDWRVYPTRGTATGFGTWLKMSTATPYNPSPIPTQPIPTDDPRGLQWIFYPIYRSARPGEVRWIQSVYKDVPWIRGCEALAEYDPLGKPPIAAQITAMVKPSLRSGGVERTGGGEDSVTKTMVAKATVKGRSGEAKMGGTTTKKDSATASPEERTSMTMVMKSGHRSETTASSSHTPRMSETISRTPHPSTAQEQSPLRKAPSSTRPTPSPSSSSALVEATSIYVSSGNVIYQGHTLGPSTTVTIGSGPVRSLLALTTNKDAETVVVEGFVTPSSSVEPHLRSSSSAFDLTGLPTPSSPAVESSPWTTREGGPSASTGVTLGGGAAGLGRQVEWWMFVAVAVGWVTVGVL